MKPRILRVLNRFNIGGPSHNAIYLTKYLTDDFETLLIGGVPAAGEESSFPWTVKHNVNARMVSWLRREIQPLTDLKAVFKLRSVINDFKPDIIHTHASKAGLTARLSALSKIASRPIMVHTFHGNVFSGYFNTFMSSIVLNTERFLAKYTDAIIAISHLQKRELVEKYRIADSEKVYVIKLGFPLQKVEPDESKARKILQERFGIKPEWRLIAFVGRLAPVKQPELFVKAVAPILREDPNCKALIIGDGTDDYKNKLILEGRKAGISVGTSPQNHVYILGYVEEVLPLYAGFDVVVLTSRNEGTPVTLIEAQAMKTPIVATDVGAVRETVCPELQDFVVGQKPEEITRAIRKAMTLKGKTLMEKACQFAIDNFSVHEMVRKTKELYIELLRRKNRQDV